MVHTINTPDPLVTCPLDESHRILKSRMQFHLVRCLKNHKLTNKIKCPWNPLHIIDKFAYEDHWRNKCENLPNAMGSTISITQNVDTHKPNIVAVPVSVTDAKLPPSEEDWDAEQYQGTYDPLKNSEKKAVLRSSIGLSRAKKKEWIRQERLRHQQLDEVLPIQIKSTGKCAISKDSCRPPHNPGIALSTSVSTIDEFNMSQISTNELEMEKLPKNLRAPYAPSPGLSYAPDDTISNCSRTKSLFDEAFGFESEQINGTSKNWLANCMPQFEDRQRDSDAASCVSNISTNSRTTRLRKFLNQAPDVAKKSFAAAAASSDTKEERAQIEVKKIVPQDKTADFPSIEETKFKRGSTAVVDDNNDDVDRLSRRLANLTSIENEIQEEKAALIAQYSQGSPKPINLELNEANGESKKDSPSIKDKRSPLVKSTNDLVTAKEMPKCAANFAKFKKLENSPSFGIGRGSVVDYDSFKNRKPGTSFQKENTNPFV